MTLPILQTTIAGSLPKPAWLAEPTALWAPWKLEGDALAQGKQDAVRLALFDQEHAGIDIVTDGEQTRRHFVTTFIEGLDGVDFANKKTVRIRNRYDADVPMVVGPVARRHPIYVDDARFVRSQTAASGQVHAARPDDDGRHALRRPLPQPREAGLRAFAEILNEEARAIAATGVDVVQFDEPAFNVYFDEVRDWGIATLERAAEGLVVQDRRAHLLRLRHQGQHRLEEDAWASEWRQYEQTFPLLARSRIDQVSLECANSRVPIDLIALLAGKDVLAGAIDVASETVETPEAVAAVIRSAL